jgi:hypothetical protein
MMRVSKVLGSLVAVGAAIVAITATTDSRADDDAALVNVVCKDGSLTVTGKSGWHTNHEAPWRWDKGEKVSLTKDAAVFKGAKCEGTVKAFICSGASCKGPIPVPVK